MTLSLEIFGSNSVVATTLSSIGVVSFSTEGVVFAIEGSAIRTC